MRTEIFIRAMDRAIRRELNRPLAFGCVSMTGTGAHDDMDYNTFLISERLLCREFQELDRAQMKDFKSLRKAGLAIEKKMMEATGGVNTHKGLLFLLLFIFKAWEDEVCWEDLASYISDFSAPLVDDYKDRDSRSIKLTSGNMKDIRHYPMTGFKDLLDLIDREDPALFDDTRLSLYLISKIWDTTSIRRSNLATMRQLQDRARNILENYNYSKAEELSKFYDRNKISSGGVADLFVVIRLLEELKTVKKHF